MAKGAKKAEAAETLSVTSVFLTNGKVFRFSGGVKFLVQSGALILYGGQDQNDGTVAVFAAGVWASVNQDTKP